jgi:exosortase/archaeosortase family protein
MNKLWFIPVGLVGIFLINSLRSAALAYLQLNYSDEFFRFNHSYTYVLTTYGMIFLFVVWWVEVYATATKPTS